MKAGFNNWAMKIPTQVRISLNKLFSFFDLMSEESPAKRQKVEPQGLLVLRLTLDFLVEQRNATTSNLIAAYPRFLSEKYKVATDIGDVTIDRYKVVTNTRDVNSTNFDFFLSLKNADRYELCKAAACNGDLGLLKKRLRSPYITWNLYDAIASAATRIDNLEMFAFISTFITEKELCGRSNYIRLASRYGSVRILNALADPTEAILIASVHERTLEWIVESCPDLDWSKHRGLTSLHQPEATLKRAEELGVQLDYADIYRRAFYENQRSIMEWAHGQFHNPELLDRLSYKEAAEEKTMRLAEFHLNLPPHRRIYSKTGAVVGWIPYEIAPLDKEEYFYLLKCDAFAELKTRGRSFEFKPGDVYYIHEAMNCERLEYLFSDGFPAAYAKAAFRAALSSFSLDVCKWIYAKFPQFCKLVWPKKIILDDCEGSERWDWFSELCPLTERTTYGFAKVALSSQNAAAVDWALARVSDKYLPKCMLHAVASCYEDWSDISFVAKVYARYPFLPPGFPIHPEAVTTRENIEFLIKNKIPLSPGFQPHWPDDFEFFSANIGYFGWTEGVRRILMARWKEKSFRKYLDKEPDFQPEEDSSWW